MSADPAVQQLQAFIKAVRPLGIGYSLPADGVMNPQFIETLQYLQSAISSSGTRISLLSGSSVSPTGLAKLQSFLNASKEEPKTQDKKPSVNPDVDTEELPTVKPLKDLKEPEKLDQNKNWESFLSESLPVVGKLYNGDIEKAAKNLEAVIGKEIGKSMAGVIWNDTNKSFNTTTEDIRSALTKIQAHNENAGKKAEIAQDERVAKMSQMLQNWVIEK